MARYTKVILLTLALYVGSCGDDAPLPPPYPDSSCQGLFGEPDPENTGLTSEECVARIEGNQTWMPGKWDPAELRSWELENPPPVLPESPFETTPDLQPDNAAVCAVVVTDERNRKYRLQTYPNADAAELAGAIVTHGVGCGTCSSLADLAVYVEIPDQTEPVRDCAATDLFSDWTIEELEDCIQEKLSFTDPCVRMWAYQARNDQKECREECLAALALNSPYNQEDGSLNPCLQCDEDNSGPVFKAVSGRTRRSSGIPAAICRPCDEVWRVDHVYE